MRVVLLPCAWMLLHDFSLVDFVWKDWKNNNLSLSVLKPVLIGTLTLENRRWKMGICRKHFSAWSNVLPGKNPQPWQRIPRRLLWAYNNECCFDYAGPGDLKTSIVSPSINMETQIVFDILFAFEWLPYVLMESFAHFGFLNTASCDLRTVMHFFPAVIWWVWVFFPIFFTFLSFSVMCVISVMTVTVIATVGLMCILYYTNELSTYGQTLSFIICPKLTMIREQQNL